MKKVFLFLAVTVMATATYAQEVIAEGITTSVTKMSSTSEQMQAQLAMMGDMTTTTYFKGNKSRTETSNPMSGDVVNIVDGDNKEMLTLMNNPMMGKVFNKTSTEPSEADLEKISVEAGSETKEVLGYSCKQYIITVVEQGQEVRMEMFTTDKLKGVSKEMAELAGKVEGFPLYMVIKATQMDADITVTTEVTEIKKEAVSDDKFDMTVPEGYNEMPQQ